MVFYGEYQVAITQGARLVLPKKLRELIKGNQFVLTKGFDKCLAGYDKSDWSARSAEFLASSLLNTTNLDLKRLLFSGAVYIELDEQGRFVLPKNLIDYLEITEKVIFVGVGDHFELWKQSVWESYLLKAENKTVTKNND
jgi:MraZ protein